MMCLGIENNLIVEKEGETYFLKEFCIHKLDQYQFTFLKVTRQLLISHDLETLFIL